MVAYRVHDSWARIAHGISNEAYTENRCSGSNMRLIGALRDNSVLRGSSPLPSMSRLVTQEGSTLLSSPGFTKVGAGSEMPQSRPAGVGVRPCSTPLQTLLLESAWGPVATAPILQTWKPKLRQAETCLRPPSWQAAPCPQFSKQRSCSNTTESACSQSFATCILGLKILGKPLKF